MKTMCSGSGVDKVITTVEHTAGTENFTVSLIIHRGFSQLLHIYNDVCAAKCEL